jgi:hypothetical protein
MSKQTYWNGLRTPARRGTAVVVPAPEFPRYWAQNIIGQRIPVVEVVLDGVNAGGGVIYLDDQIGNGWRKVTDGRGGPRIQHANVRVEPGSFVPESSNSGSKQCGFVIRGTGHCPWPSSTNLKETSDGQRDFAGREAREPLREALDLLKRHAATIACEDVTGNR